MEEMQMVEEIMENQSTEVVTCESSSRGIRALVTGVAVAAGGVVIKILWKKTENWRTNRMITKLEKRGFIVTVSEDEDTMDSSNEC